MSYTGMVFRFRCNNGVHYFSGSWGDGFKDLDTKITAKLSVPILYITPKFQATPEQSAPNHAPLFHMKGGPLQAEKKPCLQAGTTGQMYPMEKAQQNICKTH